MPFKERLKSGEPRKRPKRRYVPQDWSQYNQSLRRRGMLSLYLPKGELRAQLINEQSYRAGQSGREAFYRERSFWWGHALTWRVASLAAKPGYHRSKSWRSRSSMTRIRTWSIRCALCG